MFLEFILMFFCLFFAQQAFEHWGWSKYRPYVYAIISIALGYMYFTISN